MKPLLLIVGIAIVTPLLLLVGCEQLFSTNIFSGLERDPSKLTFEQQINYARQAILSGDPGTMAKAYDALAASLEDENNKDAELNSLAATLALGASGLSSLLSDFVELANDDKFGDAAALADALDARLGEVNYKYVDAAVDQILETGTNGGTPSEQQYVFAVIGLVLKAGSEYDGIGDAGIDWNTELGVLLGPFESDYAESDYLADFKKL